MTGFAGPQDRRSIGEQMNGRHCSGRYNEKQDVAPALFRKTGPAARRCNAVLTLKRTGTSSGSGGPRVEEGWGITMGRLPLTKGLGEEALRVMPKWTKESIIDDIRALSATGEDLSYSNVARHHVALFRAAIRYFSSWRIAVEESGIVYAGVRRYKSWSPQRIVQRILELHQAGEDLSWRHVSTEVDPQLAAAATRLCSYGSWRSAVEAAGLDYDEIRRYRDWDEDSIVQELRQRHQQGLPLSAGEVCVSNTALITAARRMFGSWDKALGAAGLNSAQIRRRAPAQRRSRKNGAQAA
jgi:hypothetical protein